MKYFRKKQAKRLKKEMEEKKLMQLSGCGESTIRANFSSDVMP